jgi:osmoprotectant transport system ATP-binding protein
MIELRGVRKEWPGHVALSTTSIRFPEGKTTALIGPSGCGKSTMLRLIMGLITPSEGEVVFDGAPVAKENVRSVRRRIGYVVQDGGLFPHMTARENVELMARHFGRPEEEISRRMDELCALTRFGRAELARYPAQLSGGQKQRVSLMRALMLQPVALLLDEPLAALDPMVRSQLQEELRTVFAELRQTILFVTHDLAEAAFLGDELVLMERGRVVQQGTFAELRDAPSEEFVRDFLRAQRRLTL